MNKMQWSKEMPVLATRCHYAKMKKHKHLRKALLATGNRHLVYATRFNKIQGCGRDLDDPKLWTASLVKGSNLAGRILYNVREQLRKEAEDEEEHLS